MTMNTYIATPEVMAIGEIHLEGNVIPHAWYQNITLPNGRPDVESIILLSEIVYWYRPTYVRDEESGLVTQVNRKFKGDALQKSKKDLADQFGFTERKVKESLANLEKLGLITRDYRTVETLKGIKASNILYIKVHPEKIKEASFQKCHSYGKNPPHLCPNSAIGKAENGRTYTYTTTKISPENITPPIPPQIQESAEPEDRGLSSSKEFSKEASDVAVALISEMKKIKPKFKAPKSINHVIQSVDLMIKNDNRTPQEIMAVFSWAISDSFWADKMFKPNPAKYLREKFDQLEMKMNAKPEKKPRKFAPNSNDAEAKRIWDSMPTIG